MADGLQIGIVLFPRVTQLDFTGPLQVFSSLPGAKVHLIWKRIEPVTSDSVLTLTPTTTFADCPQLDVICVPGGAAIAPPRIGPRWNFWRSSGRFRPRLGFASTATASPAAASPPASTSR